VFVAGEMIYFKATSGGNGITWSFGDDEKQEIGKDVFHTFKNPGEYYISASTGLDCEKNISKVVIISPPVDSSKITALGDIVGPGITITGKSTSYSYSGNAKNYEWVILNYPKYNQKGPVAAFNFSNKGTYTLQLTLDQDRSKRINKTIRVDKITGPEADNPVPPKPTGCISIFISDAAFAKLMEKVVAGEFFVNNFDPYLSSRGATPVIINKKNEHKDFAWACKDLNGKKKPHKLLWKKKVDITGVHLTRTPDNCVSLIEISYE
jgi:hypothetical protein